MTDDRNYFDALLQTVVAYNMQGLPPDPVWLEQLSAIQARNPSWIPAPPTEAAPPAPPPPPAPRAAVPLRPGRPPIEIENDLDVVQQKILKILGARLCVFQNAGKLLELYTDPGKNIPFLAREVQSPQMMTINSTRAWSLSGEHCSFMTKKTIKGGTEILVEVMAPEWIGRLLVSRGKFPSIPPLSGIVQAPTLRADGALIWENGYDDSTGIYLITDVKINMPENPTVEDARRSLASVLDLVADFDFSNPAGKTAWLSGLLSVVCRQTFDGPAPMHIIDASKRGSGKTMLADLVSMIASGRTAARMFFVADEVEMDKRISSLGLAGDQMVLIDNIVGKFASAPLDAALTSTLYRGRVLGKSETPALTMKIVWFSTGNGMIIGGDMSRRSLLVRLEPPVDHPERRTGPRPGVSWKYPNLLAYVKRRRAAILTDVLTIVAAYLRAGRPDMGLPAMGSFKEWSDVIRSAIVFAGGADPVDTTLDVHEADLDDQALRAMVECWPVADDVQVTTPTLIEWATISNSLTIDPSKREHFEKTRPIREIWRNALLEWLPATRGDLPTAGELGKKLTQIKDAIIGDYKIIRDPRQKTGFPWHRARVGNLAEKRDEKRDENCTLPNMTIIK
jgi:hypothetical protein